MEILSWKIDDIWMRINKLYFNKILVAFNPILEDSTRIPLDNATECSHIIHGDVNEV
jgi:hypothetical protein